LSQDIVVFHYVFGLSNQLYCEIYLYINYH